MSARVFKIKVSLRLRHIMRLTDEGYEAECIDAGAVGIGATQQDAFKDLIDGLESLYKCSIETGQPMTLTARDEDEKLYARLVAGKADDSSVVGYGVIERVEIVPTAAGKKRKLRSSSGFEITKHFATAA